MTNKTKKTKYGGVELTPINSTGELVPKSAHKIKASLNDRKAIALSYSKNVPCLLVGETGTGKTSLVRELAHLLKQEYVRVNMTGYTSPDELIGSKSVANGATYWENGIVTDAMQRGAILVLEEINATAPDCLFVLHSLLDDDRRISMPDGSIITPHKDFRVFATMNPDYNGTKSINQALLDRFGTILDIRELSESAESKQLIDRSGIEGEHATRLCRIANMLRKEYRENRLEIYLSFRALLHIAGLVAEGIRPDLAFAQVVVNKTQDNETRQQLSNVFKSVYDTTIEELERDVIVEVTRGQLQDLEETAKMATNLQEQIENIKRLAGGKQ